MPKEHKTSSAKVPSSVDVRNDVESSKKTPRIKTGKVSQPIRVVEQGKIQCF